MSHKYVTLITGASGGIGKEFASIFAQHGHDLLLIARREKELKQISQQLEQQFHISALYRVVDLSSSQEREQFLSWIKSSGISVSILVNNAGFGDFGPFTDADWEKLQTMIDVNISALTHLTHFFAQRMKSQPEGGKILNVASVAAFLPGPLMAVYYATKAYVLSFTEAIAQELAGSKVSVTALCPGPTSSEFNITAQAKDSKLFQREHMASPQKVAAFGYQALMQGEVVAVHRWSNRLTLFCSRFLPRSLVRKIVQKAQENR